MTQIKQQLLMCSYKYNTDLQCKYTCCGGLLPCSGKCGESKCPELCLCCETFWCFATSVMVTRIVIQQQYQLQNSPCDNCLMATMACMIQLACICQCLACITGNDSIDQCADCISFVADLLYCTVCSCMQTQHNIELDHQSSNPASIQMSPMSAPQQQTMSAQV
eukprot:TRINITY_DN7965_c0_g2_i2.p2 TRINITY_DN7965_c0_g2~~TRINITY_DN7965_c0_g2_i2.p2  ORF type:complete len:164 (-),score=11.63 TRINITY_DN7965_c0_g2_i2:720-1211(-)